MLRDKDRTAVLIRKHRCLIGSDLLGNIHDLLFVKTDQRPEHRHRADFIGHRKAVHGLACHLSDAFSCDQSQASVFFREHFRKLHHITAHDDRQFLVGTFLVNIQLDIRKVHHMETDRSAVACNQFCQIHNFLFRSLAGVRRRMEIHRVNLHSAFRNHVSCHWAVDPSGKEQHRLAVGSHRHTARSRDRLGIQIDILTDLHIQIHIRMMHVYLHIRTRVQDPLSQLTVQLHGTEGIRLFRTARTYLEGFLLLPVHLLHVIHH